MGIGGRAVVDRKHPLRPFRDRVEAGVGRDRVEPGAEGASALEPSQRAPGPQQSFLKRVLGVVERAKHPVAMSVERRPVGLDQPAKCLFVVSAGRAQ
jgi:hypothetical protein